MKLQMPLLKAAVDKADRRPRLDHLLVFDHKVEMDRFGQHRVLRTKGYDGSGHKVQATLGTAAACGLAAGALVSPKAYLTVVLYKLP